MTEDEAKTKWCPFARAVESGEAGNSAPRNCVTMVDEDPPRKLAAELIGTSCIGSACMAWRWLRTPEQARLSVLGSDQEKISSGHCGLAGKP